MMFELLTAVDCAANNKQLIDLKSSKLDLQRMKPYNTVKIISIVGVSVRPGTFHLTLVLNKQSKSLVLSLLFSICLFGVCLTVTFEWIKQFSENLYM